ncbi:MAG: hypothetical protein WCY58_10335 [Mariniphaga sp.]
MLKKTDISVLILALFYFVGCNSNRDRKTAVSELEVRNHMRGYLSKVAADITDHSLDGNAWAHKKTVASNSKGIAALYPGDEGIEKHKSVVFAENFEASSIADVVANWSWARGDKDNRLSLDVIPGPEGSTGCKSLKMTIHREEDDRNAGSDLIKIFDDRYEQLFLRFYVKFADDYGYNHHFTSLSGFVDPRPMPYGSAGKKPTHHFSSTIDQSMENLNRTGPATTPPGYWMFYTYWPEMNSWQTPEGKPDGRPNSYYGNNFMPRDPVPAKRGEWQCIEIMIRVNSAPDKTDGAHAFWVDGELAGCWDPLEKNPVKGYWRADSFISNPDHKNAQRFQGIRWRNFEDKELFEKLKINRLRVQNYVSGTSWKNVDKYAKEHPDFKINREEATVWKDHIVVATEYIGPITPQSSGIE